MVTQIGRYAIINELGRGAMGFVYKARDPLIDRFVAIKVIELQCLNNIERLEYLDRFNQEAKAAGNLSHPNIVVIHDQGETGDLAYIVMELLEGRELQSILVNEQLMSIDETLDIIIQVATGLDFAAQHEIVHLDIKPSNIMILPDRRVKIVDFGIARITSSVMNSTEGKILGTPLYMSPEQMLSRPLDSRSDIFSLGIVLYKLLTGQNPFAGDNLNKIMNQLLSKNPLKPSVSRPEVPDMLDPIVLKCLEKNPQLRYQSARELVEDLRACRAKLSNAQKAFNDFIRIGKVGRPPIHQLVYESRLTKDVTSSDLQDLLIKSQFKNIRLDLSGLLVIHAGKFMQLLEGGKKEVEELFAVIQKDSRHTDVKVVLESESNYRLMPSWGMGLSTGEIFEDKISDQNFYISPIVTLQICRSMENKVGQEFLKFIES